MASLPRSPEDHLEPYQPQLGHGPWNVGLAAHLLRRAVGGGRPGQAAKAVEDGEPAPLLAALFSPRDAKRLQQEQRWARHGRALALGDRNQWAAGWLMRILADDRAPGMRLTLFWHSHFANAISKVRELSWMEQQQQSFLTYGEGPFLALAKAMLRDPAMLRFLDGDANRRGLPNENLAREFMELFTLGVGPYSETDVQEAARALTGRTVRRGAYHAEALHHDREEKTVLGKAIQDGDDLAEVAVAHPACPRYLIRQLWQFYVSPTLPDGVEDLLASRWREQSLDITWLLRTMLSSRAFFAPEAVQSLVASPVDFVIGTLRALGSRPQLSAVENACAAMGQALGEPPGVQGWAGGESWIHTTAWLERTRFAENVAYGRQDFLRDAKNLPTAQGRSTQDLLDDLLQRFLPSGLAPTRRASLLSQLESEPLRGEQALAKVGYAVLSLPEYHLF